jgi:hypothetical protein
MKTVLKIVLLAGLASVVFRVMRRTRQLRRGDQQQPQDADPYREEPLRAEDLKVAQNAPF